MSYNMKHGNKKVSFDKLRTLPGIEKSPLKVDNGKDNKDHNPTPHFLEKKPNPTVKAEKRNTASTDETSNANNKNFDGHKEMRTNKANDLKKYTQDQKEDVAAVGGGGNRKVMKDGPKNNAIYKGKPVKGDFTPHQFQ